MELTIFAVTGSVDLEYHAKAATVSWTRLISSADNKGDVSSGTADCYFAPYWIGAAVAGAY